ncbi:MAG: hypothetical protein IPF87_15595 [Gemmatimonadetes bacterium]|jgi:hypothetical protein|nr:hypothetical protein [Gemmatimonadota bacterium]MBK7831112.1 hypothetical protein [Gemmatimonadota bacterium]MBK9408758.1 hypothetical protein [Gemmatimonadota bacterium]
MPARHLLFAALLSAAPTYVAAQGTIPPAAEQVAAAVLPLPPEYRANARVLGYGSDGKLITLRDGKVMTCLARDPKAPRFHVACYHESMEPFMARGRELRAQGVTNAAEIDSTRFREVKSGKIAMPKFPAALYSLTDGAFDPKSGTAPGAKHLYVVYIPYATPESTGLSTRPNGNQPWIMFPGTPKAHIMFTPTM